MRFSFTIRRRKALILCCALFCLCGVLATLTYQHRSAATSAAVDNWGLSFQQEGAPPVGNASADFLSTYDAWYVGDTGQPVIYLTFDAGFENGNTPAILDALKAVALPAAEVHITDIAQREPFRQVSYAGMACQGHFIGQGLQGYLNAVRFIRQTVGAEG